MAAAVDAEVARVRQQLRLAGDANADGLWRHGLSFAQLYLEVDCTKQASHHLEV